MAASKCHECLMPPPLFNLPPPPDPSLIWPLLNGNSFDTNKYSSIEKVNFKKNLYKILILLILI